MISKDEFLMEEKDCADMLGVSIDEYHKNLEETKLPKGENPNDNYSFDNSFLNYLGLDEGSLKKRKDEV